MMKSYQARWIYITLSTYTFPCLIIILWFCQVSLTILIQRLIPELWLACRMVQFGLKRHRNKVYQLSEIAIRVFLLFLFVGEWGDGSFVFTRNLLLELETWTPFIRKIHPEEIWLYKNPRTDSYVPSNLLWTFVTFVPLGSIAVMFLVRHQPLHSNDIRVMFRSPRTSWISPRPPWWWPSPCPSMGWSPTYWSWLWADQGQTLPSDVGQLVVDLHNRNVSSLPQARRCAVSRAVQLRWSQLHRRHRHDRGGSQVIPQWSLLLLLRCLGLCLLLPRRYSRPLEYLMLQLMKWKASSEHSTAVGRSPAGDYYCPWHSSSFPCPSPWAGPRTITTTGRTSSPGLYWASLSSGWFTDRWVLIETWPEGRTTLI